MLCLYCGTQNPKDAVFCHSCGKQQKREVAAHVRSSAGTPMPAMYQLPPAAQSVLSDGVKATSGISRRAVIKGLIGGAAVVVGGGVTLLVLSKNQLPSLPASSSNGTTIRVTLEPVPNQGTPSPDEMEAASTVLSKRFSAFGFQDVHTSQVTLNDQPALQIEVPHFSEDESGTLHSLLATGQLEFWSTGPTPVQVTTIFDPFQYTEYNPGGQPCFTGNDLNASQINVSDDQTGRPQINFEMKGSAIGRFSTFTANNVGQYLTITLDKKVIESAVIQSAITGPGVISGNFTSNEARALVSILKNPPLPLALREVSEEIFTS